jgi:hypothetical protein
MKFFKFKKDKPVEEVSEEKPWVKTEEENPVEVQPEVPIKKEPVDFPVRDLVLLAMLHFPNGAAGESTLHEFIYGLVNSQLIVKSEDENPIEKTIEPYGYLKEKLNFTSLKGLVFSLPIHNAIYSNCRDVSRISPLADLPQTGDTTALFCDELKFDLYDIIIKKEESYQKVLRNYVPRIFFLSAMGRSVAILTLKKNLTSEQIQILVNISNAYNGTYINTDDINEEPEDSEETGDGSPGPVSPAG